MEKAEQIRLLKELMGHLDRGTNVDAGGMRPGQPNSPLPSAHSGLPVTE